MTRRVKTPIAAWLGCAAALVLLAVAAYKVGAAQHLDGTLLARLVAHQGGTAESLAEAVAHLGDPVALLAMLAALCAVALWRGRPRDALAAFVVVAGANLTTQALKALLAHPRVQPALGGDPIDPNAFPSGHTTAAASIAVAALFVVPARLRPLTALLGAGLVAAVGGSVVLLDWHFPSDVAGGVLVAAGWGFAVLAARRWADRPRAGQPPSLARRSAIAAK